MAGPAAKARRALPKLRLAADRGDRDVTHRRVGLGAVPVPLAGLDVDDVADIDLLRCPTLDRNHPRTRGDDEDLVAIVDVPAGGAALAEIDDAAIVVRRFAG